MREMAFTLVPFAIVIVVVALLLFGILMVDLFKRLRKFVAECLRVGIDTAKALGGTHAAVADELHRATQYFAPVRDATCPRCNGKGTVEKDNELVKAIMETLRSKERKRK